MKNLLILIVALFGALSISYAQTGKSDETKNWRKMMLDPDANFFETQKAFYDYWEGKTPGKGQGYNVFKRWEYFWQGLVDSLGNFPDQGRRKQFQVEKNYLYPGQHRFLGSGIQPR